MQRALARLYTDGSLRERFFADAATGISLGLAPEETAQLLRSQREIEAFARSLHAKRLGDTARMLPATRRELGLRFKALFHEYAAAPPPEGTRKVQEDAVRFARFLGTQRHDPSAQLALELARYESAWLEAAGPCFLVRWFRLPVHRLVREEDAPPASGRGFLGVWLRPGSRGRLRHVWLRLP